MTHAIPNAVQGYRFSNRHPIRNRSPSYFLLQVDNRRKSRRLSPPPECTHIHAGDGQNVGGGTRRIDCNRVQRRDIVGAAVAMTTPPASESRQKCTDGGGERKRPSALRGAAARQVPPSSGGQLFL